MKTNNKGLNKLATTTKTDSRIEGTSFFDVVQIVFLILKIGGIVDWSWWIILSPFLISIVAAIIIAIIFVFIARDKNTNDKVE